MPNRRRLRTGNVSTFVISSLAATVTIGIAYAMLSNPSPQVMPSGCPVSPQSPAVVAIMIDRTDPLSPHQVSATKKAIRDAIDAAPPCSMVELFSLDKDWDGMPTATFTLQVPPREQKDAASGATTTYLVREFNNFEHDTDAEVDQTLSITDPAPQSPILEMTQAIVGSREFSGAADRQLVLVTDFLQNDANQFPETRNATIQLKTVVATPYFQGLRADMSGVQVSVYYLQRSGGQGRLQTALHKAFAREWWTSQHATVEHFVELPQ